MFCHLGSYDVFLLHFDDTHAFYTICETYTLLYTNICLHIYVDTYLHRRSEKKRMHVNQSKDNQFFWLIQWKLETFYTEVWKNIFFQLLMSQLAVFCELMSKLGRTIGNSSSYYKPSCVKIVQVIHGRKVWLDYSVAVHAHLTASILQWFCFFSNACISFTAHLFTMSPMKAIFLRFEVLL